MKVDTILPSSMAGGGVSRDQIYERRRKKRRRRRESGRQGEGLKEGVAHLHITYFFLRNTKMKEN